MNLGKSAIEALILATYSEIVTIESYTSLIPNLQANTDLISIARQLLKKLIVDESLHLKLINDKVKTMLNGRTKYEQTMKSLLPQIGLYTK